MLEMADKFLCWVIPAVFYFIFGAAAIVAVIGAIACFFAKAPLGRKMDIFGGCLVVFAISLFFFGWCGESTWTDEDAAFAKGCNPDFPDYSWLTVVGPGIVSLVCFAFAGILRAIGIPTIVIGIMFIGVLIFGI
jgi:hypothetical protein